MVPKPFDIEHFDIERFLHGIYRKMANPSNTL